MTTLPEEVKNAVAKALRESRWLVPAPAVELILTAALPFLPVQGAVKKLDLTVLERLAEYAEQYDQPDDNGPFPDIQDAMVTVGDLRQARKLLSILSAIEPSAAVQVNIDEIVQPLKDIHAPGGLCRWTDVATAIGEVRRSLAALEPSAARELALDVEFATIRAMIYCYEGDSAQAFEAQKALAKIDAAIRTLSSPDHADGSKSTSDQKVCQTCNDRGIIGGMHRVGDGDLDAWEETCPDCQKVKAHHSDADTGPDDLVQIALHLNCEPDADSILHVIREIQADIDIAKHVDAGKVEGDGWSMSPPKFHRYPYSVENISGEWCLRKHHGNGASHTISVHETAREARDAAPASEGAE